MGRENGELLPAAACSTSDSQWGQIQARRTGSGPSARRCEPEDAGGKRRRAQCSTESVGCARGGQTGVDVRVRTPECVRLWMRVRVFLYLRGASRVSLRRPACAACVSASHECKTAIVKCA